MYEENLPWVRRAKKIAIFHLTNWSQGPEQRGIYSYSYRRYVACYSRLYTTLRHVSEESLKLSLEQQRW